MLSQCELFIIFSIVLRISAVLHEHSPILLKNDAKKREIRSSNCGDCELNVHETFHQNFNAPVDFNQYIISNCCSGEGCTCTPESGQPIKPTPPPIQPLTSTPPTVKNNKTKKFIRKFETDKLGLDLYYIMDGTGTFRKSREELAKKATQFTESFKTLSSDYELGLGVFVDKLGDPRDRDDPAREVYNNKTGFGLWNKMPLTSNLQNFSREVGEIETTVSGDKEDILSGLHQSLVCVQEIGWRNKTKRFVLLTTDERFYQAGDKNKTAAHTPISAYDGKCHLGRKNIYNGSAYDTVDYPSIDQIKRDLSLTGITVIFAIGQSKDAIPNNTLVIETYHELAKQIIPKPIVHPLNTSSSTIIEDIISIIRNAYQESSKSINIQTTITGPSELTDKVIFTTKCLSKTVNVTNSNGIINEVCEVPSGGAVDHEVEVTLPCPWTHGNVKLTSDILGNSGGGLDLASVCN